MTMRIHTVNHDGTTAVGSLAVEIITSSERLVELYGENFADVGTPVLVIEDGWNDEAWVVSGDLLDFMSQIHKAMNAYMAPTCAPYSVAGHRPQLVSEEEAAMLEAGIDLFGDAPEGT